VCFTQGDDEYHSFPLDEDTCDVNPMDTYACSKLCGEHIDRSFARRFGVDIYVLRMGNVIEPHTSATFPYTYDGFAGDP
jgi:nucleoside-diphosphate-sugar epimerase